MASWFGQSRFDLNGLSTQGFIEHVREIVDDARAMARFDKPPREPAEMVTIAKNAVRDMYADRAGGAVMKAAGLSESTLLAALEKGRFDAVLRDINDAIQTGKVRDLPEGEAMTRTAIEAQARSDRATGDLRRADAKPGQSQQVAAGERAGAARSGAITAIEGVRHTIEADARARDTAKPRSLDDYWQAAARAGGTAPRETPKAAEQGPERGRGQSKSR